MFITDYFSSLCRHEQTSTYTVWKQVPHDSLLWRRVPDVSLLWRQVPDVWSLLAVSHLSVSCFNGQHETTDCGHETKHHIHWHCSLEGLLHQNLENIIEESILKQTHVYLSNVRCEHGSKSCYSRTWSNSNRSENCGIHFWSVDIDSLEQSTSWYIFDLKS